MAYTITNFTDAAKALLDYHLRSKAFAQTIQDKPLLQWLRANQETFPGGGSGAYNTTGKITTPVQGAYMSDTAGFVQGIGENEELSFAGSANLLRAEYTWYEVHMGLVISATTLKRDGVSINDDGNETTNHSKQELFQLTSVLKNRIGDFTESSMRGMNSMLWADGSTDAQHVPGITALFGPAADPAVGTTGGLDRATYTWWRHRALVGANVIAASPTNQTLTKALRSEARQLRRYGGKVNKIFAGSEFIEALESEVFEKGVYTQEGFTNQGKTDIGMASIRMMGVGVFEYDPTMDDIGLEKHAYFLDGRRIKLRPMEGEDMRTVKPTRPYNYMVFLQSLFWTGALEATQLNAIGVYQVS